MIIQGSARLGTWKKIPPAKEHPIGWCFKYLINKAWGPYWEKINLINILDGTDRGQRVPFWKRSRADRYYLSRLVSKRFFDSVDISSNNYYEVSKLSNNRDVSGVKPVEIPILTLLDNHYLKYQLNILLTSVTHHLWLFGLFIGIAPFI